MENAKTSRKRDNSPGPSNAKKIKIKKCFNNYCTTIILGVLIENL